ncbi:MAG TPA: HAMP domain-containing sensor histidine kinase [Actinomycetota bacterium]|nr:HAMP domain-containing sensor histidine kinase [Actinomycetota bacterium]
MDDGLRRLRVRVSAMAVLIVGAALVVAAFAIVAWVGRSMTNSVREAAQARTAQVAERIAAGYQAPAPADPQEESVQVLGPGDSLGPVTIEGDYVTESTDVVLPSGGQRTIVVARGIDDVQDAQRAVAHALRIAIPVLLLLVGLVTWLITGRTLRPVRDAAERQQRFVADAAHELRSPVASVRAHAEVASAHPETTDLNELATTVGAEGVRLQALVDDLLLLARLDEGRTIAGRDEIDLDDLVLAEAERLRAGTTDDIRTNDVSAARVRGDARSLERLVRNLGDNAARHATTVAFGLAAQNGHVIFTVDDDGLGIPPAERARVFERFVRLDESRGRTEGGTGLGLAIAREVARAHGGDVALTDSPLGGLRAEVRLPTAQNDG